MQDQVDREHALAEWLREIADADASTGASPAVRVECPLSRCTPWRPDS
jgi:hypothetical protein